MSDPDPQAVDQLARAAQPALEAGDTVAFVARMTELGDLAPGAVEGVLDAAARPAGSGGKLVRDRIPDIIRAKDWVPLIRVAGPCEYGQMLRDKLVEEAQEGAEADREELTGELADVLEVVAAIAADAGITPEQLEAARAAKAAERGAFREGIVWMGNEGEPAPPPQPRGLTKTLREAHAHYGASAPAAPTADVDPDCQAVRKEMLRQEVRELEDAIDERDLEHIAKEGADVITVTAGTLTTFGIDVDAAVAAVHASNMTKEPAGNAKAIKGPGYRSADMTAALAPCDFEAG